MMNRPHRDNTEIRQTDESTGGQKGSKPARPSLIPPSVRDELARVYGMGAAKYDDTNYLKGYNWRLSVDAMQRHIAEWELGNSYDDESELHHLAHAMWHCAALMMFEWYDLGTDDRIETKIEDDSLNEEEFDLVEYVTLPVGYCVKERKSTPIKNARQTKMKNGRGAIQGECPDCGCAIFKIGTLK